jgi:uncharacterized protein YndB with AHSA1/START domain
VTKDPKVAIEGTVHSSGGEGIVRMKRRYATDVEDLWAAITQPERLARWYGNVEGDLNVGGEFTAFVHGSHWEGRGRIDVCRAPSRLEVTMWEAGGAPSIVTAEVTADGDGSVLVIERRGVPLDKAYAYGAGWHVHVEDLSAHLAGQDCEDFGPAWLARWDELGRTYREMAVVPLELT